MTDLSTDLGHDVDEDRVERLHLAREELADAGDRFPDQDRKAETSAQTKRVCHRCARLLSVGEVLHLHRRPSGQYRTRQLQIAPLRNERLRRLPERLELGRRKMPYVGGPQAPRRLVGEKMPHRPLHERTEVVNAY